MPRFEFAGDNSIYDDWIFDTSDSEESADFGLYSVWHSVDRFDKVIDMLGLSGYINDSSLRVQMHCAKTENNYFELYFQQRTLIPEDEDLGGDKTLTAAGFDIVDEDIKYRISFINPHKDVIFEATTKGSISLSNNDIMLYLILMPSYRDFEEMQIFSDNFSIQLSVLNYSYEFQFAPNNSEQAENLFTTNCLE